MAEASPSKTDKSNAKEKANTEDKFLKNVNSLLTSETQAKRMIGVMSLYGRLYYDWTISTDTVDWRGPIQHLLGVKGNHITGDMFLRKLTFEDFSNRIELIAQRFKDRKSFEIEYHLKIGEGLYCLVKENAELLFTREGVPAKILGSILVSPQALAMKPKARPPKDKTTGVLSDVELEKALSSSIAKSQREKTYGAFVSVSIDKLTNIAALSGEKGVKKVIKFVSDTLTENIRDGDSIGRISGNTFGLVLYNCDRWGIVSASERLLGKVQEAQIKIGSNNIDLSVSSGGAVFPCETLSAVDIMNEAGVALADAQNTKGIARFWAPSIIKGGSDKPPEEKVAPKGKRRMTDKR